MLGKGAMSPRQCIGEHDCCRLSRNRLQRLLNLEVDKRTKRLCPFDAHCEQGAAGRLLTVFIAVAGLVATVTNTKDNK